MSDEQLSAGVAEVLDHFQMNMEVVDDFDPVNDEYQAASTMDGVRDLDGSEEDPYLYLRYAGALIDLMEIPFTNKDKAGRRAVCAALVHAASWSPLGFFRESTESPASNEG